MTEDELDHEMGVLLQQWAVSDILVSLARACGSEQMAALAREDVARAKLFSRAYRVLERTIAKVFALSD